MYYLYVIYDSRRQELIAVAAVVVVSLVGSDSLDTVDLEVHTSAV
jgi:hypothetical protein